jgi:ribosome-binding protein aMBF1 (putative translation factor)
MTTPLNWKTDPLLREGEKYRSLNTQLEHFKDQRHKEQLLRNPLKNFYGLLIKKRDFKRRKNTPKSKRIRILARMPYISLQEYHFIQQKILGNSWQLAEAARDYFYHSAQSDHSISSWKQRIERYANKGSIPLPILRVDQEIWKQFSEHIHQEQQIIIQSAKQEPSKIPLKLSEKLVYLLGMIDGDGHLTKHQVHIVDYSKEQIKQLQKIVKELFAIEGEVRKGNGGKYYILLANGKWVVKLINYLTEHALGRKYQSLREPVILREKPYEHLRGAYWRGLFDADASYKRTMVFTTISLKLINDLERFLDQLVVKYRTKKTAKGISLYIYAGSRQKVCNAIGCWHPEKREEVKELLSRRRSGETEAFQGIEQKHLTAKGFFNFNRLDQRITVQQMGKLFQQYRKQQGLSRKDLAKYLKISYFTLTSYEKNRTSPPLQLIKKFASLQNVELMFFLHKHNLVRYGLIKTVRLPLQPSKQLSEVMIYLFPGSNQVVSLSANNQKVVDKLNNFFELKITSPSTNRLYNYVLWDFLKKFGKYKTVK